MTPFVDDMTAILISISCLIVGGIMVVHSVYSLRRAGWLITGLAALGMGIVYAFPVLFNVPVVEIRVTLRLMLFLFMLNYAISHRNQAGDELRKLHQDMKQWKSRRK